MPNLSWLSSKTAAREIVLVKGGYILDRAALAEVQPALGPAEIPVADGFFIGPWSPEEREGGMIFSNHSCDPNIGVQGQIVFVAMRYLLDKIRRGG